MRKKKKKVRKHFIYYRIPKDLPEGRYDCTLKVQKDGKRRLIVFLETDCRIKEVDNNETNAI